ncbi:type I-F CRISPR-associated endoribonuclease Cas6/Csy4 [Shimwellia pseudoproteus]|uniref:type I-F CRISPR-associated endoribonuclease Cas6/Csy4 n=1 Tax=Shimwellia pseudoproteus TaxID=570012 RepID=UPI0018EB4978|nr:type I-F CRISPR-associated endoribonuclease Cas6/Csy4 [Shimwellia pseudoproteus]MBJ3814240.1 type I-F CRISPR-associated endoribonuclease Cas6/Csy4 [Shimwellia pseudoproteus]
MDSYQDIRVLPDPEFTEAQLLAALFAKLHRALGTRGKGDIGVSFPEYDKTPGGVLRLHGERGALEALEATRWRGGLNDYSAGSAIQAVPVDAVWRTVSRVQVKSSAGRLLRRSVRKGWLTEEEACQRLLSARDSVSRLPFIQMRSLSSGQSFRLFISLGAVAAAPVSGTFTSYGLSAVATIPWF